MDYSHINTDDLITDQAFVSWVQSPSESSQKYWNNWLRMNPDKEQTLLEAKQFILNMEIPVNHLSQARKKIMLNKIHEAINMEKTSRFEYYTDFGSNISWMPN